MSLPCINRKVLRPGMPHYSIKEHSNNLCEFLLKQGKQRHSMTALSVRPIDLRESRPLKAFVPVQQRVREGTLQHQMSSPSQLLLNRTPLWLEHQPSQKEAKKEWKSSEIREGRANLPLKPEQSNSLRGPPSLRGRWKNSFKGGSSLERNTHIQFQFKKATLDRPSETPPLQIQENAASWKWVFLLWRSN